MRRRRPAARRAVFGVALPSRRATYDIDDILSNEARPMMVRYVAVFFTSLMLVCCRSEIVKPQSLFDIQRGASRAEVSRIFNGTGKHQFTAIVDGDEVLCASYPVNQWYIEYYFVFHNKELTKILNPRAFDDVDDQDPEWRRDVSKPVDPEQRLLAVLEARGLWGESLEQNLKRRLPKSRKGALDQFPLVVYYIRF